MSKRNKAAERAARAAALRAAALRAEQERREKQRRLYTIAGVVGALLVVVAVGFWLQSRAGKVDETAAVPTGATSDYGLRLGDAGADHEVVIYEDFLCPACKAFEDASAETLDSAVADGRATVEYRPLDFLSRFGDYSQRTANAFAVVLDAAGPDVAKKFHDILYAEQPAEEGDHPDDAWLIEKAVEAGATEADVAAGFKNLEFGPWVANGVKAATSAGIKGTPTVIVDGEAIEASTLAEALK
ncbi:thioredoxin domain-containing protein [Nocardioides sp.]|uniref:DsbA family protein n=1 Tax=Nocardioides sp. TaxID=35761 RepID=UPI00286E8EDB|nr:thioredoxin domain-containing protein [Nocardioides sp.]